MFALCWLVSSLLTAQQSDNPLYRDYRAPSPSSFLLRRGDLSYNLLQLFLLERKANAGDFLAQHELGLRYLLGEGVGADTVKAAYWISRASMGNFNEAKYNYGILLFNGIGLEWNPFEAYRQFRVCAEGGMPEAQFFQAMILTENFVVQQNWESAYSLLKQSAAKGNTSAQAAVKDFEARGLGVPSSQRAVDTSKQRKMQQAPKALGFVFIDQQADTSNQNNPALLAEALRDASPGLLRSLGVAQPSRRPSAREGAEKKQETPVIDLTLIQQAAEEGSPEALLILARSYEQGIGVKKSFLQAAVYYLRAIRMSSLRAPGALAHMMEQEAFYSELKSHVDAQDPDAQFVWASLVAYQLDYPLAKEKAYITEPQALELLEKAASKLHVQSLLELGLCYYSGRWTPEDREKAIRLWKQAAGLGNREAVLRLATLATRSLIEAERNSAVVLLSHAAQGGSILAQVALAYCYETGAGIPKKTAEAVHLYRTAAQRGNQSAFIALKRLHDSIRPKEKEFEIREEELQ
ncbi:MAG: hypothetical protein V1799_01880 [bacterium]